MSLLPTFAVVLCTLFTQSYGYPSKYVTDEIVSDLSTITLGTQGPMSAGAWTDGGSSKCVISSPNMPTNNKYLLGGVYDIKVTAGGSQKAAMILQTSSGTFQTLTSELSGGNPLKITHTKFSTTVSDYTFKWVAPSTASQAQAVVFNAVCITSYSGTATKAVSKTFQPCTDSTCVAAVAGYNGYISDKRSWDNNIPASPMDPGTGGGMVDLSVNPQKHTLDDMYNNVANRNSGYVLLGLNESSSENRYSVSYEFTESSNTKVKTFLKGLIETYGGNKSDIEVKVTGTSPFHNNSLTLTKIDLVSNGTGIPIPENETRKSSALLWFHVLFMTAAWGICLPWGAAIAAKLRNTDEHLNPNDVEKNKKKKNYIHEEHHSKGKSWFYLHIRLQVVGSLLSLLGFIFAINLTTEPDIGTGSHFQHTHTHLALIPVIVAMINPVVAIFRPHKPEKKDDESMIHVAKLSIPKAKVRKAWEISHIGLGYLGVGFGILSILLGGPLSISLGYATGPDVWGYLVFTFSVIPCIAFYAYATYKPNNIVSAHIHDLMPSGEDSDENVLQHRKEETEDGQKKHHHHHHHHHHKDGGEHHHKHKHKKDITPVENDDVQFADAE